MSDRQTSPPASATAYPIASPPTSPPESPSACSLISRSASIASSESGRPTSILHLPVEVLFEVSKHLPPLPIPGDHLLSPMYTDVPQRWEVLLALSQACRALRAIFLPLAWRHIEACIVPEDLGNVPEGDEEGANLNPEADEAVAISFLRQLDFVTDLHPSLAEHVQTVNAFIGEFESDLVAAAIATCFPLLPNLVAVQLHSKRAPWIPKMFKDFTLYAFPSIVYVSLPGEFLLFLAACPNAKYVHFLAPLAGQSHLARFKMPSVERVTGGFYFTAFRDASSLFPNVKQMMVYTHFAYATGTIYGFASFDGIAYLKHIENLEIYTWYLLPTHLDHMNIVKRITKAFDRLPLLEGGRTLSFQLGLPVVKSFL